MLVLLKLYFLFPFPYFTYRNIKMLKHWCRITHYIFQLLLELCLKNTALKKKVQHVFSLNVTKINETGVKGFNQVGASIVVVPALCISSAWLCRI